MTLTPSDYREETLKPFFNYIKGGESFFIIGAPSVGKTRLVDFVMGDDSDARRMGIDIDRDRAKKQYLGSAASKVWLVRVDMNRIRLEHSWGFQFFELMLHSLLLACDRNSTISDIEFLKENLAGLDSKVIQSKDDLMAHRLFEMAVNRICQIYNIQICFLFDEFDETYRTMPIETFAQLRAIRDSNKYMLSYILFLRNLPEKLRNPKDNESFYELISRNVLGLGPYAKKDALNIIEQLEKRRDHVLPSEYRDWVYTTSGGHPGLIQALFTLLKENPSTPSKIQDPEWFVKQEIIREEFRKIWNGLIEEEQIALQSIAQGDQSLITPSIGKQLIAKGIIKPVGNHIPFFTPLLGYWLK